MPNPSEIEALFTRADGSFLFARWGRPIAPVVIGVDDATLATVKGAFEAVATLTGRPMLAETDPELGANCMVFFFRDWDELAALPDLDRLIPDLGDLLGRLKAADANQYRIFRFEASGAIKAVFVFLRVDDQLAQVPAEELALAQVVQVMLTWSDTAFRDRSVLARAGERVILRPDIAALIRAAYDPVLPAMGQDPSLALRLSARMEAGS
ncbi:hypothetical protein LA6_004038 [Marinibacterium anthonyi]|nr:hypothetical protein LA6_004038 [Marinibacterium anthonyi]